MQPTNSFQSNAFGLRHAGSVFSTSTNGVATTLVPATSDTTHLWIWVVCILLLIWSLGAWGWFFFRKRRFFGRLLCSYLPFCLGLGIVWCTGNPNEWIVALATALSIWLAGGAIDLGLVHENELRQVQALVQKLHTLIRGVFGLENYIDEASQLYEERETERVVTSLRHWVARGTPATFIERGIQNSTAEQLIFVGTIKWDVYYPGVLWRFERLRDIIRTKGKTPLRAEINHVEPGVPIFVVSKRKRPTPEDHGSLLVGNPLQTGGTNLYGVKLGSEYPRQVDHYNFVFDTLICPKPELVRKWADIFTGSTGIVQPYTHKDGLAKLFEIKPFFPGGEIYAKEEIPRTNDAAEIQSKLIEVKAQWFGREIHNMIQKHPKLEEERQFLPNQDEIVKWSKDFLIALCEQGILQVMKAPDDSSEETIMVQFQRKAPFDTRLPHCSDFFILPSLKPQNTVAAGSAGNPTLAS